MTSARPGRDREAKRCCYARARIPLYLLVDRDLTRVTLYSEPQDGDYHQVVWVPFGKSLALPEPLSFELDTAELG